jgi:hypothetical protein
MSLESVRGGEKRCEKGAGCTGMNRDAEREGRSRWEAKGALVQT